MDIVITDQQGAIVSSEIMLINSETWKQSYLKIINQDSGTDTVIWKKYELHWKMFLKLDSFNELPKMEDAED